MVGIYSSNNGLESSSKVSFWNLAKSSNPIKVSSNKFDENSFARAVYGDGPHNLLYSVRTSDVLARELDILS